MVDSRALSGSRLRSRAAGCFSLCRGKWEGHRERGGAQRSSGSHQPAAPHAHTHAQAESEACLFSKLLLADWGPSTPRSSNTHTHTHVTVTSDPTRFDWPTPRPLAQAVMSPIQRPVRRATRLVFQKLHALVEHVGEGVLAGGGQHVGPGSVPRHRPLPGGRCRGDAQLESVAREHAPASGVTVTTTYTHCSESQSGPGGRRARMGRAGARRGCSSAAAAAAGAARAECRRMQARQAQLA